MTEQYENQQDGNGFEELPACREEECCTDAEEIPRADAQHDEGGHAQRALPGRAPCSDEERPARINDCGAREEEQPQVQFQPERRRRRLEETSHRRVDEDRHGEDQAEPESIAHVADHGRQIVAGMTHFMRHIRRHGGRCAAGAVALVALVALMALMAFVTGGCGRCRRRDSNRRDRDHFRLRGCSCHGGGLCRRRCWHCRALPCGRARARMLGEGFILGVTPALVDEQLDLGGVESRFVVTHRGVSRREVHGRAFDTRHFDQPSFHFIHSQYRQHVVHFNDARLHCASITVFVLFATRLAVALSWLVSIMKRTFKTSCDTAARHVLRPLTSLRAPSLR